jgi:hypothetical protein
MSESNNKDVNDLENLNLHDEFDEDDGYDMESLNKEPNGHLEKIFQTTAELQARAKTKKQTDVPKSNQLKTLKPRPDNKEVIIIPSNQIINSNGAQLFYDSVSNTLIQLNTQQPRNIQIQNIKKTIRADSNQPNTISIKQSTRSIFELHAITVAINKREQCFVGITITITVIK